MHKNNSLPMALENSITFVNLHFTNNITKFAKINYFQNKEL